MLIKAPNCLTFKTVEQARLEFAQTVSRCQTSALTLDLTSVEQMDSSALAYVIEAQRLSQLQGIELDVQGCGEKLKAMGHFFGVADTLFFNKPHSQSHDK